MKYIEKTTEESRTGATQKYHIVSGLQVDYVNSKTFITMTSFVSKEAKDKGKEALSVNTFTINAAPDWSVIPYEFALNELIKPQPEDFEPEEYAGYVNPYMFAGGKIKETDA
ncbi:hypothetical protein [Pasteurella bettyae]|uniref:hypothetical protein n=1 Tax=Pasteurella bettyae TaxID=752 RepID=UPI003D2B0B92